jgi:hypothetical protein
LYLEEGSLNRYKLPCQGTILPYMACNAILQKNQELGCFFPKEKAKILPLAGYILLLF